MEKELKELIRTNKNDLYRYQNKRDDLRNKIKFCTDHCFQEEVRISLVKIDAMDMIIYDYEQMIKDLEIILKSDKK
jgi:hypothetical protein